MLKAMIAGIVGIGLGYLVRNILGNQAATAKEARAKDLMKDAERDAAAIRKEAELQAKTEVIKAREDFEKSTDTRRREMAAIEERLSEREINLDRKVAMLDKKQHLLDEKIEAAENQAAALAKRQADLDRAVEQAEARLQQVASMTRDEARQVLLSQIEQQVRGDAGTLIRRIQEEAKATADRQARNIVAQAVQRYGASHAAEMTTSSVALPNDDMKGRIIGRDGRNIRALEAATGMSVLIDDTPEAVVISGFDPVRREVARQALETLVADGRIHPARIEEIVEKARESMDEIIRTAGEAAAYDAGAQDVPPELIRMLGRLKYRTSYTQNVLQHSLEVAHLMGVMAGEMGLDVSLAKRVGLFHDIGKAMDHEIEGGHAVIGADFLKKQNEQAVLVNAVAAHHEEVEAQSVYAVLASAADAISSSRVGARSETTDIYIKRLEKLEGIANGFKGVAKSYAIQAGREIRVVVDPEQISDSAAQVMALDISKEIEKNLQYPGQIRVVVVRETRCVEYAR